MGQSGLVQLDKYGDRTNVDFHIRKLEGEHDYVQGSWNPSNGLLWSKTLPNFIQNDQDENANKDHSIRFEPLIITTVLVRESCTINLFLNIVGHELCNFKSTLLRNLGYAIKLKLSTLEKLFKNLPNLLE